MKKNMLKLIVVALLISPMLSSCNTKKLEEENAALRESLTSEKAQAEGQIKELAAKVEGLTKANEELKAEAAKAQAHKAPAVKKGHKK